MIAQSTGLLSSNVAKASLTTSTVSVVQQVSTAGTVEVSADIYALIAVVFSLAGVYLARLVTIDTENKRLGRVQTLRETGPLTWIGILLVGPLIWHFKIAVPWASMIGVGVGYSVRIVLKIAGNGAVGWMRVMVRQAADALDENDVPTPDSPVMQTDGVKAVLPPNDLPQGQAKLLAKLDDVPDRPLPPAPKRE